MEEIDLEAFISARHEAQRFMQQCPRCHVWLRNPPGGGVVCWVKNCGYWFCY